MSLAMSVVESEEKRVQKKKEAHLEWKLVGQYATQEIEGIACLALI